MALPKRERPSLVGVRLSLAGVHGDMSGPTSPKRRRLRQKPAQTKLFDTEAQTAPVYGRNGSFRDETALNQARAQSTAAAAAAAKLPETVDLSGGAEGVAVRAALTGARVRVYWAGDCKWFTGVVGLYKAALGYHVHYVDGDEKWHQLTQLGEETWQLLSPAHGGNAGLSQHDAGLRLPGGAAPAPPVSPAPPAPPTPRAPPAPPVPRTPPTPPTPPAPPVLPPSPMPPGLPQPPDQPPVPPLLPPPPSPRSPEPSPPPPPEPHPSPLPPPYSSPLLPSSPPLSPSSQPASPQLPSPWLPSPPLPPPTLPPASLLPAGGSSDGVSAFDDNAVVLGSALGAASLFACALLAACAYCHRRGRGVYPLMRQVVGATRPQGQHAKGLRTKELPVIISDIEQQATSSPSVTAGVDDLVKRMVSAASAHPPSDIEASLGQSEACARGAGDCGTALREVPRVDGRHSASLPPAPPFDSLVPGAHYDALALSLRFEAGVAEARALPISILPNPTTRWPGRPGVHVTTAAAHRHHLQWVKKTKRHPIPKNKRPKHDVYA